MRPRSQEVNHSASRSSRYTPKDARLELMRKVSSASCGGAASGPQIEIPPRAGT